MLTLQLVVNGALFVAVDADAKRLTEPTEAELTNTAGIVAIHKRTTERVAIACIHGCVPQFPCVVRLEVIIGQLDPRA
jgi:hypothetical protein